jgi:hypothetical protein
MYLLLNFSVLRAMILYHIMIPLSPFSLLIDAPHQILNSDTMDVLASSDGEYHIKLTIRNKADNFIWSLVAVYGVAQDAFKANFLRELVNLAKDNPYPIIIGGDFNLLRF